MNWKLTKGKLLEPSQNIIALLTNRTNISWKKFWAQDGSPFSVSVYLSLTNNYHTSVRYRTVELPASFMDNWLTQLIHVTSTFKTCFQVFWESLDELVLMIFFIYNKTLNNELLDDLGMWKYFCSSLLTF